MKGERVKPPQTTDLEAAKHEVDLQNCLKFHTAWLKNDPSGIRANLRRADLRWADLRRANLRRADLRRADLRRANLQEANLQEADLRRADLRWADLRRANLRWADLQGADLRRADLRWADLRWADLQGADLRRADLRWADLRWADLDFSVLPLWCGSFDMKADHRLAAQLAYHFCRLDFSENSELQAFQDAIKPLGNQFHLIGNGVEAIK